MVTKWVNMKDIFSLLKMYLKGNCLRQRYKVQPRWRHRYKPFTSPHNHKEDNNQSKNNKQPEVPENQTAWNSNNQGIKETVNQINHTGKRETREMRKTGQMGWWREPLARQRTTWVGLAERGMETQSWLWTMEGVATVEETPVSQESSLESWSRAKQANCIVPSLSLPS